MAMDYVYMVCNIAEPEIPEQRIPTSLYFNTTYNINVSFNGLIHMSL